MSKYKIVWSEFAEWNLDQIYNYILGRSFSLKLTKKFMGQLVVRVEQLEKYPFSGNKEVLLSDLGKDFRYLVYKDYKIVYFVEDNTVYITDIFHTKLSPSKLKRRNT